MDPMTVGDAARQTGWSARMLRYLERTALVVPPRSASGYRLYGLLELNQLRSHGEREVAEFDLLLEQGMGADEHVDVAERELAEDVAALASTLATGEDGNIDAGGGGERRHGVEVLARQNFGRRHQRGLPAG